MKPCISNLLLEYIFSLIFTREFIVVCARAGGANTTSFLAAHFAKRNTKNCGGEKRSGESEGGQKFLPPNPLPFCPPERLDFKILRQDSRQKSSDFNQKAPQYKTAPPRRGYFVLRKVEDLNLREDFSSTAFQVRRIRPLCQPSKKITLNSTPNQLKLPRNSFFPILPLYRNRQVF